MAMGWVAYQGGSVWEGDFAKGTRAPFPRLHQKTPMRCRCRAASRPTCSTPTAAVRPKGVAVTLCELSDDGSRRLIASTVTNHDGRTDAPLIAGQSRSAVTNCVSA
jgi:hypothetical protein